LFNLKPNGDYLTVRANCLENNLVLWKFEKGKRSAVKWVRNTPTATNQWHDLKVRGSRELGLHNANFFVISAMRFENLPPHSRVVWRC